MAFPPEGHDVVMSEHDVLLCTRRGSGAFGGTASGGTAPNAPNLFHVGVDRVLVHGAVHEGTPHNRGRIHAPLDQKAYDSYALKGIREETPLSLKIDIRILKRHLKGTSLDIPKGSHKP